MRVSEHFDLDKTQPSLDFVDVDVENDVRLFIDPRAFVGISSEWGTECVALIRDYFSVLLGAVCGNDRRTGLKLLGDLKEPRETGLGLSIQGTRGRGVGNERTEDLWKALRKSEAVQSGLIEDLEDTILMIYGIGPDIISDITTNILREPLIEYTQAMCQIYSIPIQESIPSGPLWNPRTSCWYQKLVDLPLVGDNKLILVPKIIVRIRMTYDVSEYYTHYLLEELRSEELSANSGLVEVLKNGMRRVTKKALMEKYGTGKSVLVEQTLKHPDALRRYRNEKRLPSLPLSHIDLMRNPEKDIPDWDNLLNEVLTLETGRVDATKYEKAIQSLLYALFYPALVYPKRQDRIHEGRKIIDITFTNAAREGFFYWLALQYCAPKIIVECKNYTGEVGNPELDQLSGRFSPNRGRCGILICRSFDDKKLFMQRCRDTADEQRGFIIALEDSDLVALVAMVRQPNEEMEFALLRERFERLIM